jgi:hypothetical protein
MGSFVRHPQYETSDTGNTAQRVYVQDQTSPVLTVPFLIERSQTTLAVDAVVNSRTVTLTTGHGALVGEILEIADSVAGTNFIQSEILVVAGDVITLDKPVNYPYPAATSLVVVSSDDILVDGSVTPKIFSVLPLSQQSGDMVRIIWEMRSTNTMDFETFGGASSLTNGCVVRVNNGDGTYRNLFNFKSNGDVIEQTFDYDFQVNTGNSVRGFTARLTWGGQSKHGVVIRLDGSKSQSLELVVQDDLTGINNDRFHLTAQGHELQGI